MDSVFCGRRARREQVFAGARTVLDQEYSQVRARDLTQQNLVDRTTAAEADASLSGLTRRLHPPWGVLGRRKRNPIEHLLWFQGRRAPRELAGRAGIPEASNCGIAGSGSAAELLALPDCAASQAFSSPNDSKTAWRAGSLFEPIKGWFRFHPRECGPDFDRPWQHRHDSRWDDEPRIGCQPAHHGFPHLKKLSDSNGSDERRLGSANGDGIMSLPRTGISRSVQSGRRPLRRKPGSCPSPGLRSRRPSCR